MVNREKKNSATGEEQTQCAVGLLPAAILWNEKLSDRNARRLNYWRLIDRGMSITRSIGGPEKHNNNYVLPRG